MPAPLRIAAMLTCLAFGPGAALAQAGDTPPASAEPPGAGDNSPANGTLRIQITDGVTRPTILAIEPFELVEPFETSDDASELAAQVAGLIAENLTGTGLFVRTTENLPEPAGFDAPVVYDDWYASRAEALVTGAVSADADRVSIRFRLFDILAGQPMGDGMQFDTARSDWRRAAHKASDQIYMRLTGETGLFDSRIAFVSETGPRERREKRIGIMDVDGANVKWMTDGTALVLAPSFSPDGSRLVYISFGSGQPRLMMMDVASVQARPVGSTQGMAFAPRWSPDGRWIVYSREMAGNSDIWLLDPVTGEERALTADPAIDTAPDFSPDGTQIVFESDRSGSQQLYVMPADGGEARRITFGEGSYASPAWSPKGDLIAFTKIEGDRYHIGTMRPNGNGERLLTQSFLDEGPSWAPNGRVVIFTRETPGANGHSRLHSVDVTGRNMRALTMQGEASDPSWGRLLP